MAAIATTYIEIQADASKAEAQTKDAARKMGGDATKTLAQVFSAAIVVREISKMIGAASRLEQAVGGTEAVFGKWQKTVDDASKGAAKSMGLSEAAFREVTTRLGGLLVNLGFAQEEAAKTSVSLAQVGADLSAAFGGKPEEAVLAIGAAFRGEYDSLERWNITLRASDVNQRAVEMGLASSTTTVSAHARAMATLDLIQKQSASSQGQFGREADTAAGRVATATAQFENMRAKLGAELLPIFVKATNLVSTLVNVFASLPGPIQMAVLALAAVVALAGPLGSLVTVIKSVGLAISTANPYLLAAGAAAVVLTTIFVTLTRKQADYNATAAETASRVEEVRKEMEMFDSPAEYFKSKFTEIAAEDENMRRGLERTGLTIDDLADAAASSTEEFDRVRIQMINGAIAAGATEEEWKALRDTLNDARYEGTQAAKTQGELNTVMEDSAAVGAEVKKQWLELQEAQAELRDEIMKSVGALFDYEKALLGLEGSYAEFIEKQTEATLIQLDSTRSTEEKAAAARSLRNAELDVADSALQTAQAYAREKGAADGSKESAQLQAAQLARLAEKYPELRDEIGTYIGKLAEIPGAVPTQVQALIDEGKYAEAEARLERLARGRTANVSPSGGGGNVFRSAAGRYVGSFMVSSLGEEGPEAVLPLTKPSRLAELLGDERIGGPVREALGAGGGGSGSGRGTAVNFGGVAIYTQQPAGVREELEQMVWSAKAN